MINAGIAFNPDSYIFDLEDAVSITEKDAARDLLSEALFRYEGRTVLVRINAIGSPYWQEDFEMCLKMHINAIVVPKATAQDIKILSEMLDQSQSAIALIPLIETPRSVEEVNDIIKSSPRVCGVCLGAEDYCLNLGVQRTKESNEIAYVRAKIANAASAYDIEAIDTPFTDIDDLDGLKEDTLKAKKLGFIGKMVINPKQVNIVNEVFSISKKEVEHARRIVEAMEHAVAAGKGACQLDGKMIDAPILERARKLIEKIGSRGEMEC
jgi:citrate lyase subunit beta / citryl-CoA lyase